MPKHPHIHRTHLMRSLSSDPHTALFLDSNGLTWVYNQNEHKTTLPWEIPLETLPDVHIHVTDAESGTDSIDIAKVQTADQLIKTDLLLQNTNHPNSSLLPLMTTDFINSHIILGRYSLLASILLSHTNITSEQQLYDLAATNQDSEWVLLAEAAITAVFANGLDSVFDQGEIIDVALTFKALQSISRTLMNCLEEKDLQSLGLMPIRTIAKAGQGDG